MSYYYNLDRMISGSRILWNASTVCWWPRPLADGKSQNERRFGESFQDMLCLRVEFGKKKLWLLRLKNWKVRCIRNISQKTECERSPDNPKGWRIYFSCGRWFSKIARKRLRFPRTHSETGIHNKERERISTENLMAIGKSFNLKKQKMTKESMRIFWPTQKLGKK